MARNSGKTHRIFPSKKSGNHISEQEKARLRKDREEGFAEPVPQRNYTFKEVQPLNFIQGEYLDAIDNSEIIFGIP